MPAAVSELWRVCAADGALTVVIPCEGSLAYGMARRISAQRVWHRHYPHEDYRWFIEREHVNLAREIQEELQRRFHVRHRRFFPLPVPAEWCNLVVGLTLEPRRTAV